MSAGGDKTVSPYGRGACPVCRREFALTKAGKVRHHGAKDGSWPPERCKGAGKEPT